MFLGSVRSKVVAILAVLLALATVSVTSILLTTRDHDQEHLILDVITYQRQLSQDVAFSALASPQSSNTAALADRFQWNMHALREGGTARLAEREVLIAPQARKHAIDPGLHEIASKWQRFYDATIDVQSSAPGDPARMQQSEALQALLAELLQELDDTVVLHEANMARDLRNLRILQAVFFLTVAALIYVVYDFTYRRIIRPEDLVQTFQSGDTAAKLPREVYADEVAQLVQLFEVLRPEMLETQRMLEEHDFERTRELLTAFEFSQEIVSVLDRNQILESAVVKAEVLVTAHSAAICLSESGSEFVELVSVHGKLRQQVPFAGAVQGLPIQIIPIDGHDKQRSACRTCAFEQASASEHVFNVPLRVREVVIGSLCVARDGSRPFSMNEQEALQLLANSTAIALGNAHLAHADRRQVHRQAIEAERARLAAELHDNLAQTLGFLNLKTDRIRQIASAGEGEEIIRELDHMKSVTGEAYQQVRNMLDGLQGAPQTSTEIQESITQFVDEFRRLTGLAVNTDIQVAAWSQLAPEVYRQGYLIVREALINCYRHADARKVNVAVFKVPAGVCFEVEDDGKGFDLNQDLSATHLGIQIMRMRALRSHGTFNIDSKPGDGTRVTAVLPTDSEATLGHGQGVGSTYSSR